MNLRMAAERHNWRTAEGRRRRYLLERVKHVADRQYALARFIWWCHGAMMVRFQMDSADIPEGDEQAARAVTAVAWQSLAELTGVDADSLGDRVNSMVGTSFEPHSLRQLLELPMAAKIRPRVGELLVQMLTCPQPDYPQIKLLIGLGKKLVWAAAGNGVHIAMAEAINRDLTTLIQDQREKSGNRPPLHRLAVETVDGILAQTLFELNAGRAGHSDVPHFLLFRLEQARNQFDRTHRDWDGDGIGVFDLAIDVLAAHVAHDPPVTEAGFEFFVAGLQAEETRITMLRQIRRAAHHIDDESLRRRVVDAVAPFLEPEYSEGTRAMAIFALPALQAVELAPHLFALLSDRNYLCTSACLALGRMGAVDAIPHLVAVLSDPTRFWVPRGAAAVALAAIGPPAAPALPALRAALTQPLPCKDENWDQRSVEAVEFALNRIGGEGCRTELAGRRYEMWGIT